MPERRERGSSLAFLRTVCIDLGLFVLVFKTQQCAILTAEEYLNAKAAGPSRICPLGRVEVNNADDDLVLPDYDALAQTGDDLVRVDAFCV